MLAVARLPSQLSLWCSQQLLCELHRSIVFDLTWLGAAASHRSSSLGETERVVRVAVVILGGPPDRRRFAVTQLRDIPERGYV